MNDLRELDEFDLDELSRLAPTDLSAAAPDWELARERVLGDIIGTDDGGTLDASAAHRPRSSRIPRLAIAAAALLVVGTGVALTHPGGHSSVPAVPAGAPSSIGASSHPTVTGTLVALRQVPAGSYLVLRTVATTTSNEPGLKSAPVDRRVTTWDSQGHTMANINGTGYQDFGTSDLKLTGAPADPAALGPWLVSGKGGTYAPKAPLTPGATASAWASDPTQQQLIAGEVMQYLVQPQVTQQFRRALLEVARQNPTITITHSGGSTILTRVENWPDRTERQAVTLDSTTLDPSRNVLEMTGTNGGTAFRTTYDTRMEPVQIVTKRP